MASKYMKLKDIQLIFEDNPVELFENNLFEIVKIKLQNGIQNMPRSEIRKCCTL